MAAICSSALACSPYVHHALTWHPYIHQRVEVHGGEHDEDALPHVLLVGVHDAPGQHAVHQGRAVDCRVVEEEGGPGCKKDTQCVGGGGSGQNMSQD